jgi:hypothetical protein
MQPEDTLPFSQQPEDTLPSSQQPEDTLPFSQQPKIHCRFLNNLHPILGLVNKVHAFLLQTYN